MFFKDYFFFNFEFSGGKGKKMLKKLVVMLLCLCSVISCKRIGSGRSARIYTGTGYCFERFEQRGNYPSPNTFRIDRFSFQFKEKINEEFDWLTKFTFILSELILSIPLQKKQYQTRDSFISSRHSLTGIFRKGLDGI